MSWISYPTTKQPEPVNKMLEKLDLYQAARLLGCTYSDLYKLIDSGTSLHLFHKIYRDKGQGFHYAVQRGELEEVKAALKLKAPSEPKTVFSKPERKLISMDEIANLTGFPLWKLNHVRSLGHWPIAYEPVERIGLRNMYDPDVVPVVQQLLIDGAWRKDQTKAAKLSALPDKKKWLSLQQLAFALDTTERDLFFNWKMSNWPQGYAYRFQKTGNKTVHYFDKNILPELAKQFGKTLKESVQTSDVPAGWYTFKMLGKELGIGESKLYTRFGNKNWPSVGKHYQDTNKVGFTRNLFDAATLEALRKQLDGEKAITTNLLKREDIANQLEIHPSTVMDIIRAGQWPVGFEPVTRIDRAYMYKPETVDALRPIVKARRDSVGYFNRDKSDKQKPAETQTFIISDGIAEPVPSAILKAKDVSHAQQVRQENPELTWQMVAKELSGIKEMFGFKDVVVWIVQNKL